MFARILIAALFAAALSACSTAENATAFGGAAAGSSRGRPSTSVPAVSPARSVRFSVIDDGVTQIVGTHRYVSPSGSAYLSRKAGYQFTPRNPALLSLRHVHILQNECEYENAVELRGYLQDLNNKTVLSFNPLTDQLGLSGRIPYLISIEVVNRGLCQTLDVGYDLSVD